jgi:hypothetical protein
MLFTCICISVNALEIINTNGISKEYDNAGLYKHERQELKTSREKDGVVRLNNWQGFRFDVWLKEQDLGQFSNIRFESEDKYLVTLSSEEFQAMESWIVVAQDEKDFEGNSLRLIFPSLREMQWVRDLSRVVLENFKALPYPSKFMLMKPFLDSQNLLNEPKPFVNTEGWYFSEFLPQLSESKEHQVVFYSRDGLKQNLNYPYHLEGAVLEKTKEDTYNLKSPQIPGGMWLRDIVYLQCDGTALIEQSSLNSLIALHKLLGWDSNPGLSFSIHKADEVLQLGFADALAEPQVFEGALFFELK